jgi:putative ABC transport system permease protein
MFNRVPLAWLQLTHQKLRLLAAIAGIAFAVVLMLFQLGLLDALFTASSVVQSRLQGDLILVSRQYQYMILSKNFSNRRLYQALGFDGVESVWPVYLGLAQWKNPEDLRERSILTIGYDPVGGALSVPEAHDPRQLTFPDAVLFDAGSRSEFGPVPEMLRDKGYVAAEVNGRKIRVVGLFRMGTSFGIDGTLITSDLNFLRIFPTHPQDLIEIGLVRLKPGADIATVQAALEKGLPPDVRVLTQAAFVQQEKDYWATNTGVGYVFTLGVFIGFVVGAVIVYQILYTDVNDHLAEFATLKALGYGDFYLSSVVLRQSLILSLFGFAPGVGIAYVLYTLTQKATLLPMVLHPSRVVLVLVLTIGMCSGSALLAMKKLRQADPAEIF